MDMEVTSMKVMSLLFAAGPPRSIPMRQIMVENVKEPHIIFGPLATIKTHIVLIILPLA